MTTEMASTMIKQYTKLMNKADACWDKGDTDAYDKWLCMAQSLNWIVEEYGYEFKKTYDGKYVIVEK